MHKMEIDIFTGNVDNLDQTAGDRVLVPIVIKIQIHYPDMIAIFDLDECRRYRIDKCRAIAVNRNILQLRKYNRII